MFNIVQPLMIHLIVFIFSIDWVERRASAEVIHVLLSSCSAPAKLVNVPDADEVGVAGDLGWALMNFKNIWRQTKP